MYKITFNDVGRRKCSWTIERPTITADDLIKNIHSENVLMSKGIDVEIDMEELSGQIFAGMRCVGTISIELSRSVN